MATLADLERAHLLALSAEPGEDLLSLDDLRRVVYAPDDFTYWSTLSGLTPIFEFSLTDHRRKAMQIAEVLTDAQTAQLSSADLSVLYWTP